MTGMSSIRRRIDRIAKGTGSEIPLVTRIYLVGLDADGIEDEGLLLWEHPSAANSNFETQREAVPVTSCQG